ncbi:capsule assembly Wzi family protein [Pelodictyon luteolum]|nr:capsule assembly Wzi family protein [Pelodictyon luteolum]
MNPIIAMPGIRTTLILFFLLFIAPLGGSAQQPDLIDRFDITAGTAVSSDDHPPFWMWANRDGIIPDDSGTTSFTRLQLGKEADDYKRFDWTYGLDVTARTAGDSDVLFTDAYVGFKFSDLHLTLGRKSEFFGLADSLLTVGPEAYSRNAPPIPKIALSTNGFVDVADWLGVNAYFAHGWLGSEQYLPDAYLHEKFLYLKLGSTVPDEGINFLAGIHHLAEWGGEGQPSGFKDFLRILVGKSGDESATESDQINALGNHLGSIEYALQFKGYSRDWYLYIQTLFEDGSGLRFWYPADYLAGLSLINKEPSDHFRRLNVEYIDTRSGGKTPTEPDNYFTNGTYGGWVHEGWGIGHPFIRFISLANNGYSPLNRITGANASLMLQYGEMLNPLLRVAWVRNSGSFSAPLEGEEQTYLVSLDVTNTMYLKDGWSFSQQLSLDTGSGSELNPGMLLRVTKSLL